MALGDSDVPPHVLVIWVGMGEARWRQSAIKAPKLQPKDQGQGQHAGASQQNPRQRDNMEKIWIKR